MNPALINHRSSDWRQHLHLLAAVALLPVLVAVYYLSFWLRFEGQLDVAASRAFRATAGWVILTQLLWFVALPRARDGVGR